MVQTDIHDDPVNPPTWPVLPVEGPATFGLEQGPASWRDDLRRLLIIAGPIVASTSAESLISFVDYAIVSCLGPPAQAAVQSGCMVFFSVFAFVLGMMTCVSTVVSQSLGAGRPRDCSAYAWQGLWLSLVLGTAGVVLGPGLPSFFAWVGHTPEVQVMEVGYTRIRFLTLGFAGGSIALSHFFNGIHRPRQGAYAVVASNVLNGILAYGLVLGKWGLPAMGVEGAAIGTFVASAFRLTWLVVALMIGPSCAEYQPRRTWRLDLDKLSRLVRVGWPAGAAFALDIGAWCVFLVLIVGRFGTAHLAATSTIWRLTELAFMPAVGIGLAVCAMVGRSIGAGRPDLARRRAALGTGLSMAYMGAMGLVFLLFGVRLLDLFTNDAEVIAIGAELLVFVAAYQLFDAAAITMSNALRGAGDTRWPAVVGALQAWTILVAGGWAVARFFPEFGSRGPWAFAAAFVIVIGTTFVIRWKQGKWEQIDVIGRTTPASPSSSAEWIGCDCPSGSQSSA